MTLDEAITAYEDTPFPWVPFAITGLMIIILLYAMSRSDGYGGWKERPTLNNSLMWVGGVGALVAFLGAVVVLGRVSWTW